MVVKVSDIPEEGLKVVLDEDAGTLGGLGEEIVLSGPVKAEFSLKVVKGDTVYVTGTVAAKVELTCARCGRTYTGDVTSDVRLDLNPVESLDKVDEKELEGGDLDVEFYSNGVIDLAELVAGQVALGMPMKPLCSEDCKGVCQYCGKDLNEGDCDCTPETGHIGLAGLKDLLDKMKQQGEGKDGKSD